jgi:hypothetical protein
MWYQTVTEAGQTTLPGEKMDEQQSDSLVNPTAPVDAEKVLPTPGSEYWLP